MNLKSMSIDDLIGLRSKVDAVLGTKVADERRTLKSEPRPIGSLSAWWHAFPVIVEIWCKGKGRAEVS